MPGYAASEQAFLSLVKSLHKGKGKENVPTDICSLAQSYGKVNGDSIAPPPSDVDEDVPWPDHRPTAIGAQEEPLKPSPLEKIFAEPIPPEQPPATYTVIGSNFAPDTTAADIEAALSDDSSPMQHCRIISESPVVVAEMVFTEKSRAENVIAAYDNKKADGYLLRLYMKPQHEKNTPSAASHKEVEAVQTKGNTVTAKVQHAQQPPSPVLRGRGRNRYTAVNGSAEPASKIDSEAPRSQKGLDMAADMINVEDKEGLPMGSTEADPIALIDEMKFCEKDRHRMSPKPTSSKKLVESSQESKFGEPIPVDVLRRLAMIDSKKQSLLDRISVISAGKESLMGDMSKTKTNQNEISTNNHVPNRFQLEASVASDAIPVLPREESRQRSVIANSSKASTSNITPEGQASATELPTRSRPPSLAPIADQATAQPATGSKPSSTPLLSSGQSFFEALSKRPFPPKYTTTTTTNSVQNTSLPDDVVPDELPAATLTQPNSTERPSSPLTQITTTGTLQTPSGEHTIHLAPQSSIVQDNTSSHQISSVEPKAESPLDVFPQYRPNANPLPERPISPVNTAPNHSDLPRRPPRVSPSFPPANLPPRPLTNKMKALTLLSGSRPTGRVCLPIRYSRNELVQIGKAYRERVFLALLAREGKGRLVLGIGEGL